MNPYILIAIAVTLILTLFAVGYALQEAESEHALPTLCLATFVAFLFFWSGLVWNIGADWQHTYTIQNYNLTPKP